LDWPEYNAANSRFIDANPWPEGPEELDCSNCDGTGFMYRWLLLSQLR
jgi:hypothetical protein